MRADAAVHGVGQAGLREAEAGRRGDGVLDVPDQKPAPELVTIDLSELPEEDRSWVRDFAVTPGTVDRGQIRAAAVAGGDGVIAQSARDLVHMAQADGLNAELADDPETRSRQHARRSATQVMQQVGWSAPPARLPHPDDPDTSLPSMGNSGPPPLGKNRVSVNR